MPSGLVSGMVGHEPVAFRLHDRPCPGRGVVSGNQHIVMPWPGVTGQNIAGQRPQAALGPVPGDGIADLAGGGDTDSRMRVIAPVVDLHHQRR